MRFVPAQVAAELLDPADEAENFEYRARSANAARGIGLGREPIPAQRPGWHWIKFVRIWNVWPNEPGFQNPLHPRAGDAVTYVPLLALGLVGAWRYRRWGWPYVLAWLPAVYLTLLHVVFVGSMRYREPAMLALAVLAAGVLTGAAATAIAPAGAARRQPKESTAIVIKGVNFCWRSSNGAAILGIVCRGRFVAVVVPQDVLPRRGGTARPGGSQAGQAAAAPGCPRVTARI